MNRILVTGIYSDRFYAAIQTETGYLFHNCTVKGMLNEREFQRAVPVPGPKDIVIDRIQILSRELRIYSACENRPPNSGKLSLLTSDGICHQFYISAKHSLPELRRFFELSEDEIRRPERRLDYGRTLPRREKDSERYLLLFIACIFLEVFVFLSTVFLPYVPWMILGLLALLGPPALALAFPQWFTMATLSTESKFRYGKKMYPVCMPMLFFPAYLTMRLPEVTYLDPVRKVLLFAFPLVPLAIVVWRLSPERKAAPRMVALVLAIWTALGAGTGFVINSADYYCRPPAMCEQRRVTELEERTSSNGLHSYYVHLDNAGSELTLPVSPEYYSTLTRSSFITVDFYNGILGVPYACVWEEYGD